MPKLIIEIGINNTHITISLSELGNSSNSNLTCGINANANLWAKARSTRFNYASGTSVFGDYNSWLNLGTGSSQYWGRNSFMSSNYHVNTWWNIDTSRIPAMGNYWVVGPYVNLNKADCTYQLPNEPTLSGNKLITVIPDGSGLNSIRFKNSNNYKSSDPLPVSSILNEAISLFDEEKYEAALAKYEYITEEFPNKKVNPALNLLVIP
jgi:hypothetical protein